MRCLGYTQGLGIHRVWIYTGSRLHTGSGYTQGLGIHRVSVTHRVWIYTGSGYTQGLGIHRVWVYTGSGYTQGLGIHRVWVYTGSGYTQGLGIHRVWIYTGSGYTQGLDIHRVWIYTVTVAIMGVRKIDTYLKVLAAFVWQGCKMKYMACVSRLTDLCRRITLVIPNHVLLRRLIRSLACAHRPLSVTTASTCSSSSLSLAGQSRKVHSQTIDKQ